MPELIDLPAIQPNDVTDDDLLLIFDAGAATLPSRKVKRGDLLRDVARTGTNADASFGKVDATDVQAPVAAIDRLSVATGLEMGATLSRILTVTGEAAIPALAAGVQASVTLSMTGALVGDAVTAHMPATLPPTLVVRAAVSAPDVVTIYVMNVGTAQVAAAIYSARVVALRFG